MREYIASLEVTDLGNGYVNVAGTAVIEGDTHVIDYDAPRFMVDALISAARQQGALT